MDREELAKQFLLNAMTKTDYSAKGPEAMKLLALHAYDSADQLLRALKNAKEAQK